MYRNTVAKRRFSRNFSALLSQQKWSPISQLLFEQEMSQIRVCSTARSGGPSRRHNHCRLNDHEASHTNQPDSSNAIDYTFKTNRQTFVMYLLVYENALCAFLPPNVAIGHSSPVHMSAVIEVLSLDDCRKSEYIIVSYRRRAVWRYTKLKKCWTKTHFQLFIHYNIDAP
jgi:hypothetical protein